MAGQVLLSVENLSKSFGARPLFEGLTFTVSDGDHIALIGPNGSGKSTLLRILAGLDEPDSGMRTARREVRAGYVPQDPVFAPGMTAEEVVIEALSTHPTLERGEYEGRAALALGKAGFTDRAEKSDVLSGGWRKRLAIARELALEPDVLLLDEPTNHLDIDAILWLESVLRMEPRAFIVVSHDRYFLETVARRVLDLDRAYAGGLLQTEGSYSDHLERRDETLRTQEAYRDTLANLVRREVEWLRRGSKARTTKSKARIDSAGRLIDELREARTRSASATAGIEFSASGRRTKRLLTAKKISKRFDETIIVSDLDLLLTPGSRLGIVGPNGSGKTTLLRMIVGEIEPDEGAIDRAEGLRTVYFEQNRESLDPSVTLLRALAPEGDSVVYGERSIHVASWARRFLFRPEQLQAQVSSLSGGEKARVVLARLMLQPADLLVLDEPTNDLDIPTLEVLEDSLLEFAGAIVLVTHDRYLLDRLATQILVLDGDRGAGYFADYAQWEESREARPRAAKTAEAPSGSRERTKAKRLSYLEQREWDEMEGRIEAAELALQSARTLTADPAIASDAEELQRRIGALDAAQLEVDRLYARWAELEAKW